MKKAVEDVTKYISETFKKCDRILRYSLVALLLVSCWSLIMIPLKNCFEKLSFCPFDT